LHRDEGKSMATPKMSTVDSAALRNGGASGRVTHDERGNAIWSWGNAPETALGFDPSKLEVMPDTADSGIWRLPRTAAHKGFNPYESGIVERDPQPRKRDLRELSRWIELRKKTTTEG
jgi:hypothetical protein